LLDGARDFGRSWKGVLYRGSYLETSLLLPLYSNRFKFLAQV